MKALKRWARSRWAALGPVERWLVAVWFGFLFAVSVAAGDWFGAAGLVAVAALVADWLYLRSAAVRFALSLGEGVDGALGTVGADGFLVVTRPVEDEVHVTGYERGEK